MASDVTLSNVVNQANKTEQQALTLSQDLDDFLNLLTIQLQHQDPLNPTDTDKLTDQITQFSQVEQQINTNQKLDDLLALQLASLSSIGLGYVGLDVSYVSAEMNFDGENPVQITYALSDQASSNTINIYNEAGEIVYTEKGATSPGQKKFTWDGSVTGSDELAEPGTYSISVNAFDADNKYIDTTTVVTGNVRGIENQNGVIFLLVGDRAVSISNVLSASQPGTETPAVPDETEGTDKTEEADSGSGDTGDENA